MSWGSAMPSPSVFDPVLAAQPDRLAIAAHERGLDPAPPDGAAVLELACGDGANLLPLAYHRPGARFVGLEGAPGPARAARASAAALGLKNVEILEGGLEALDGLAGRFDYVLVPGVLSTVSDGAADATVATCARMLAPQGVAYVDHLGSAGMLLSQRLRELLRRQVAAFDTVRERVERIREILAVLDDDSLDMKQPHTVHARLEVRFARTLGDAALVGEVLSPYRRTYSPSELSGLLVRHGLEELAEAWDPSLERRGEASLRRRLAPLTRGAPDAADLLELMTGPRRRGVLVVRSGSRGSRASLRRGLLERGAFAARLETRRDDILYEPTIEIAFATRSGAMVRTRDPLHKAVLATLRAAWPRGLSFQELIDAATARLPGALSGIPAPTPSDVERQAKELLELHALDAVSWSSVHPPIETRVTEHPLVSPLTRWQAQRGHVLTDTQHRLVAVDELTRRLIGRLDGASTLADLVRATRALFDTGELAYAPSSEAKRPSPDALVKEALEGLAAADILIPGSSHLAAAE